MKKLISLFVLCVAIITIQAQELKGVYLGSYTKINSNNPKITTLIGKDYALSTVNIKSGKVAMVIAIPYDKYAETLRTIPFTELKELSQALTDKYNVEFTFVPLEKGEENKGWLIGANEVYTVLITVTEYNILNQTYSVGVSLRHNKLELVYKKELQSDL